MYNFMLNIWFLYSCIGVLLIFPYVNVTSSNKIPVIPLQPNLPGLSFRTRVVTGVGGTAGTSPMVRCYL